MSEGQLLEVENLRVSFRHRNQVVRAVDGVSFSIGRKETLCVVGESGSGKSVTALSILGLIQQPPGVIESGRIVFAGRDLLGLAEQDLQRIRGNRIAMVFQEPMTSLNPLFTIGDQIGETIRIHAAMDDRSVQDRTVRLLADVGIPSPSERLQDYPHQLSGGQRQRVMIAMALACGPDLVIADEPTTALDVTIQAQILDLFQDLKGKRDMSLLYITHDLGVVASIADRIAVMYAGLIVEQGSTFDIFDRPAHPYSRGLLASRPQRSRRGQGLYSIPGQVPDPAAKPAGCPFHPRCDLVEPSCKNVLPVLAQLGGGHFSRCPVTQRQSA